MRERKVQYVYINGILTPYTTVVYSGWECTNDIDKLKWYLNKAVSSENYEEAAQIRDRIKEYEE